MTPHHYPDRDAYAWIDAETRRRSYLPLRLTLAGLVGWTGLALVLL